MDITETKDAVVFQVKVQPRSSIDKISGMEGVALKIKLMSPPVEGAANAALIEYLSGRLKVKRSAVHIIKGLRSRNKLISITGLKRRELLEKLGYAEG